MALEIVMPRLSDSMEEGTILQWLVAEGDQVQVGQHLVEVETDKATVVYDAQDAGVILALNVGEGASVPVGAPIAILGAPGEELPAQDSPEALAAAGAAPRQASAAAAAPPETSAAAASPEATAAASSATRTKASPLARRLAADRGVDIAALAGSGPGGRVIRSDVERAAAGANGAPVVPAPADYTPAVEEAGAAKGRTDRQDLTRIQATVARRMAESRATVPDIELQVEVDMSRAVALREQLREVCDPVPSINDLIVKAAARALREFPRVNGAYRDGRFESYSRVNVGIAVAAEDSLVVPTIFDADRKSLGEIAVTARALAAKVRGGSISPSELAGGTFTVSNLGMHGVDSFTAVINQPQAAIVAVGSLRPRPVVDQNTGEVVARPTVLLNLACDHRILYGVHGAQFLARVRELLERPLSLLV